MAELSERIERAMTGLMKEIADSAIRRDVRAVEELTRKASELRAMKDQSVALENRLRSFENGAEPKGSQRLSSTLREFFIEVTQGMINQNLLTLTEPMKRAEIRGGEHLVIKALPSGDTFETELLESGNKLRERGRIGRFYRDAGVRARDTVVLKEITPGRWELMKVG